MRMVSSGGHAAHAEILRIIQVPVSGLMHEDLTGRRGFGPRNLLGTLRILR